MLGGGASSRVAVLGGLESSRAAALKVQEPSHAMAPNGSDRSLSVASLAQVMGVSCFSIRPAFWPNQGIQEIPFGSYRMGVRT